MATWDSVDHYFSGQGVVLMADRDALGKPKGYNSVGNVSDLKITVSTSVLEHKESHTGQRGTDLRLTTETKVALSLTMENFIAANLASALRGEAATIPGGSVVAEAIKVYPGKIVALDNIKVSSVVPKIGASTLTAYTNDATPWDYLVNEDAGSLKFNDGSTGANPVNLGVAATALTVGATTSITTAAVAAVGDEVTLYGFSGADAAAVNGKTATVLTSTGTIITVDINTTGKTVTFTGGKVAVHGAAGTVDYTYADQIRVDSLTQGSKELYLRFEGLNTAEDNSPVVVEVFKFNTDPLKELALIGDGVQQFVLEGNVLADSTKATGSKYFKTTKLN